MVPRAPTYTRGPAAEDPQRQAPRPLPVLRPPDKLSEPSEVLSRRRQNLAQVAKSSHARKPDDVGTIHRASTTSSVAATSDSPCLDVTGESGLRNPLREICTVGSVREEPSRWCHGGPKRARSWKQRIQPRKTYSLSGLLYSERRLFTNIRQADYRRKCRFVAPRRLRRSESGRFPFSNTE